MRASFPIARLDEYLRVYINAAALAEDSQGFLFRSAPGHAGILSDRRLLQSDAHAMIRRRAKAAGIRTLLNNHSCRAGGITLFRQNGGALEKAQLRAGHADIRTTSSYDHSDQAEDRADVERMAFSDL